MEQVELQHNFAQKLRGYILRCLRWVKNSSILPAETVHTNLHII